MTTPEKIEAEASRMAYDAYPHRNPYLEGGAYMSEERSREPLREAYAQGYHAAFSAIRAAGCLVEAPVEEQVERAAAAMWDRYGDRGLFAHASEGLRASFLKDARAALAAAGVAPSVSPAVSDHAAEHNDAHEGEAEHEDHAATVAGASPAPSKRRLRACVDAWPECATGEYNPACCRFPKSCSATVYDSDRVDESDLDPAPSTEREKLIAETEGRGCPYSTCECDGRLIRRLADALAAPHPDRENLIRQAEYIVRVSAAAGNPVAEFGVTKDIAFVRGVRWAADALAASPVLDEGKLAKVVDHALDEYHAQPNYGPDDAVEADVLIARAVIEAIRAGEL